MKLRHAISGKLHAYLFSTMFLLTLPHFAAAQGKIVFTSARDGNEEIYAMNPNGANRVNLTVNASNDTHPAISPDGSKIAFVSLRDGNQEIYSMSADGTNQTRLTAAASGEVSPKFSPDGTKIVFVSDRDGNPEIYIMNADGTDSTRLTNFSGEDLQPVFSPDGAKIVFARNEGSVVNLYSMNANGTNPARLTNTGLVTGNGYPAFSPDGTKIVFTSARNFATSLDVYVMNADGTNQVRLTTAGGNDTEPAFSPDGAKIVFRSERDGDSEIYLMDAAGTNQARVTFSAGADAFPFWGNLQLNAFNLFGQARAWGYNVFGQLGNGTTASPQPAPVDVFAPSDIIDIRGGQGHSLALRSNGTVWGWGNNQWGQTGNGTASLNHVTFPAPVPNLSNVAAVSGGGFHSLALKADGTVWAWGNNFYGQIGNGTTTTTGCECVLTPTQVSGLIDIIAVSAGLHHNLALDAQGRVWAWGINLNLQIGSGSTAPQEPTPVQVAALGTGALEIAAGRFHSMALKRDGTIWVWGNNSNGQIGNGTTVGDFATPQQTAITNAARIAAGNAFNVALKSDGTVWTWGINNRGQLGNGTVNSTGCLCNPMPQQTIMTNATDVRVEGSPHVLARRRDGAIFAWGDNRHGAIGNGTIVPAEPFAVPSPVQSNVGAGNAVFGAGFWYSFTSAPIVPTPAGTNVAARLGEARLSFATVAASGNTIITAIDPTATGLAAPPNYTILPNAQGYNISTTAVYTGSINVCVKVPTVGSEPTFDALRLLHGEAAQFVDRTTTRDYLRREICGSVTSLSPFVLALVPTAAPVSVAGRVVNLKGGAIGGAIITLINAGGAAVSARSNSFGYFRFEGIAVGATYVLQVRRKGYQFAPQIVSVSDDIADLVITPEP